MQSDELKKYIPDDIRPNNLNREYLLSVSIIYIYIIYSKKFQVLAFVDNVLYLSLYESYKEIKEERVAKKWGDYEINVIEGVKGILENFQSVDENSTKIAKPLRFPKNGKINGYFEKNKQRK